MRRSWSDGAPDHASAYKQGIHALAMKQPPKLLAHPLPSSACLQRDLMSMSFPELLKVAKQLKHAGVITTLRLFVSLSEQHIVNQRFSSLDRRTTDAVFEFTRCCEWLGLCLVQLKDGCTTWK